MHNMAIFKRCKCVLKALLIFIVLTAFNGCIASPDNHNEPQLYFDCTYYPIETQDNHYPELTLFHNCAYEDKNGSIVIRDVHLKNLLFDDNNLASVYFKNTDIVYVNRRGKTARVLYVDNGADYFKEGLARTVKDGKIGFIDKNLDVVIRPKFDFAFPFSDGIAVVCNGCYFVPDGEHSAVVGGKWGYIDKNGVAIVPVSYEKDNLPQLLTNKSYSPGQSR